MSETLVKKMMATSLILCWVIPPFIIGGIAWLKESFLSRQRLSQKLSLVLGVEAQIGSVENPRPGTLLLKDVRLTHPLRKTQVLVCDDITVHTKGSARRCTVKKCVLNLDGLNALRRLIETRWPNSFFDHDLQIVVERLVIHRDTGHDNVSQFEDQQGVSRPPEPAWVGPAKIFLRTSPPTVSVELVRPDNALVSPPEIAGSGQSEIKPGQSEINAVSFQANSVQASLEWTLEWGPEEISQRLVANSMPVELVEAGVPTPVFTAGICYHAVAQDAQSYALRKTVFSAQPHDQSPIEMTFSGVIECKEVSTAAKIRDWRVSVHGMLEGKDLARLAIISVLGIDPDAPGRLVIRGWEISRDGLISGDCLLQLDSGMFDISKLLTWQRLFKCSLYLPSRAESDFLTADAGHSIGPFSGGQPIFALRQASQGGVASRVILIAENQADNPTRGLAALHRISFSSLQMRLVWDQTQVALLPAGGEHGYWILAMQGNYPLLSATKEMLGTRVPWESLFREISRRGEGASMFPLFFFYPQSAPEK